MIGHIPAEPPAGDAPGERRHRAGPVRNAESAHGDAAFRAVSEPPAPDIVTAAPAPWRRRVRFVRSPAKRTG